MKIALLQFDLCWNNVRANIEKALFLINKVDADLYVLPEMWSTGFATQPEGLAHDEKQNEALQWMRYVAAERCCAISGSLAIRLEDGTFRNRHYFVDGRNHQEVFYDKHHLFTYGGENKYYTAGQEHTIISYEGFRILLLTCYDLRFPCWSRYSDGLEYDIIVVAANWPQSRQSAWQLLTRARAVENQAYLVGVNRVGDDECSHYIGASCAIDPIGKTIGQCHRNQVEALTVKLSLQELYRRRDKFRVLDDRD